MTRTFLCGRFCEAHLNDHLHISTAGLAIEKAYEKGPPAISPAGFATRMYYDDAGYPTIGWGHLITSRDEHLMTATVDESIAETLLRQDNLVAENAVKRLVKVKLTQHEFDALTSFTFNVGEGNLASSTLLKKLNRNDRRGAANEFPKWNKLRDPRTKKLVVARGLERRRDEEMAVFLGENHV